MQELRYDDMAVLISAESTESVESSHTPPTADASSAFFSRPISSNSRLTLRGVEPARDQPRPSGLVTDSATVSQVS